MKRLQAKYIYQHRTMEAAMAEVLNATSEQLEDYVTDYMSASYFGYELICIVNNMQTAYPKLYRGSLFEKKELFVGNEFSIGAELVSTTVDCEVAMKFAACRVEEGLSEEVFETYVNDPAFNPDSESFEQEVYALFSSVLFEIEGASGLYLNSFFDYEHEFTKEKEVLINAAEQRFVVVDVEHMKMELKKGVEDLPFMKVRIRKI